ncbi:hypothetical protein GCM10025880_14740 [Methylorubrum aminovorans]|nr:hypothetical protein GCM10025880_14740 [Methylorubrum aminovorans]
MPVTSVIASRLTALSEKPSALITQKVGSTESGSATAAIRVARQSLRNRNTTITARAAPSNRPIIAEW